MLSMIPGFTGTEYKSNAEKKVFKLLQESNITAGYAFHSVGLPVHERKSYSEADFIVVTPRGIVCLEVKGGSVDCNNGVWSFQNRYGEINYKNEGPFEQAAGSMFALKTALIQRLPWVERVSFATGVIFTDITFTYRGVSVIPEIIYDFSSRKSIGEYIDDIHTYWDLRNHRRTYPVLSQEDMDELRGAIRDDLHFVPSLQTVSQAVDKELIRLTEEQIKTLDLISDNEKILVSGPAGSGKTLLAVEYAKRKAEEGKRVLYLTYNKGIALYLSSLDISSSIVVKTLHGLINDYIALDPQRMQDPNYYSTVLPDQFFKYLCLHNFAAYDILVIDEGQDLINTRYFPIFDKLLKRGLYNGNWVVFYDPNQNIFNQTKFDKSLNELLRNHPVRCKLTKNCRNTEQIADFTSHCSTICPGEAHVSGNVVSFISYDEGNLNEKFDELIENIVNEGIPKGEIKIISKVKMVNSAMANYLGKFSDSIENFNPLEANDKIQFATIQAFKGLDARVVIATDITDIDSSLLLYTLFTRARTLLYLFVPKRVSIKMQEKIIEAM